VIEDLLYKDKSNQGQNIEEPILNALEHAKIGSMSVDDIDAVFLVGGMTYYHTIQERIYEIFGRRLKPIKSINPMFAVSRGAAIYHHQIDQINFKTSDQIEIAETEISGAEVVFTNTVPNNIYIDVIGADPVALLEKGTKLPFERIIEDRFIVTGQSNITNVNAMQLELFTATSAKSIHTKKLKSATINFKKPVAVNSKLVLKVECNKEREVSVKAWLEEDETEVIDVNIGAHEFTEKELESIKEKHKNINKLK
jgi:molecular chaperone DnaK